MLFAFCCLLFNVIVNCNNDTENEGKQIRVNDIANALVNSLDVFNERINELKEKIKKIDSYVVDRDKYYEHLLNELRKNALNETSFFQSLNETDDFNFLKGKESRHLYLQMKERMNRDDVMKILSERGQHKLMKSARKMMLNDLLGTKGSTEDMIDFIVDKFIAQKPEDSHNFKYRIEDDADWDPEAELEELKEYHNHDARRLFKGERTNIKYYPFMVSIHVMGRFWCGGVIYSKDLVITSAACLQLMYNNRFYRENPDILSVRVGSNHSRIGGEMVEALEVYFHPGYNSRTLRHNIAVIRLRRHLFFSYHRIPKRIQISHNEQGVSPTSEVLLLGWGVTKMTQKLSYQPTFLNRKILPVYPNVFCKEVYGEKFITSTMFCAGTFTTGEGACDHDAGGPAVIAGKLVGIISFGPAICGYPNTPTVFTLIGAYAEWIEAVADNMPTYYTGKKRTTTLGPGIYYTPSFVRRETTTRPAPVFNVTTPAPALRNEKKLMADSHGWSLELYT